MINISFADAVEALGMEKEFTQQAIREREAFLKARRLTYKNE